MIDGYSQLSKEDALKAAYIFGIAFGNGLRNKGAPQDDTVVVDSAFKDDADLVNIILEEGYEEFDELSSEEVKDFVRIMAKKAFEKGKSHRGSKKKGYASDALKEVIREMIKVELSESNKRLNSIESMLSRVGY